MIYLKTKKRKKIIYKANSLYCKKFNLLFIRDEYIFTSIIKSQWGEPVINIYFPSNNLDTIYADLDFDMFSGSPRRGWISKWLSNYLNKLKEIAKEGKFKRIKYTVSLSYEHNDLEREIITNFGFIKKGECFYVLELN